MDDGDSCTLLFLDMSLAFDNVDHLLLGRLLERRCGLRGTVLKWSEYYLTNWTQSVAVGEALSSDSLLQYGVPQGSILEPVLFLIYTSPVADIFHLILGSKRTSTLMTFDYAFDSTLRLLLILDFLSSQPAPRCLPASRI